MAAAKPRSGASSKPATESSVKASVKAHKNAQSTLGLNRISFSRIDTPIDVPYLLEIQRNSFDWLIGSKDWLERKAIAQKNNDFMFDMKSGLEHLFEEISPIMSQDGRMELHLSKPYIDSPVMTPLDCKKNGQTYDGALYVTAVYEHSDTGNKIKQTVSLGNFPLMTPYGTFVVNGTERSVVSQISRAPGVYFNKDIDKDTFKEVASCRIIPARGSWLEFEIDKKEQVSVRIDRRRKQTAIRFLKAIGVTNEEIEGAFHNFPMLMESLEKDRDMDQDAALKDLHSKVRPGEVSSADAGTTLLESFYFNPKRYDLTRIGRYKLNKKLASDAPLDEKLLRNNEILQTIRYMSAMFIGEGSITKDVTPFKHWVELKKELKALEAATPLDPKAIAKQIKLMDEEEKRVNALPGEVRIYEDDIDHFGNRRVRQVGELVQNVMRQGLQRIEKTVRDRMTSTDAKDITAIGLINVRPLTTALKEFYGQSALSQFMDQNNPLASLSHRRRLSSLGEGGLKRDRAAMEVRDVHPSHYGRMCPIESPEGQNIGLIGALSSYARVNGFGFIETPYRKVENGRVTDEIHYLTADEEADCIIAQANQKLDKNKKFSDKYVLVRNKIGEADDALATEVNYMDVSPSQMVSIGTSLIPFLEHDDANRALMGANMQKQAVPLVHSESAYVGTGIEFRAAKDAGDVIMAHKPGIVKEVGGNEITVANDDKSTSVYEMRKFERTNQTTCFNHTPLVKVGDKVRQYDALADGSATKNGELALGTNLLVAFMNWDGFNFEDAIIISERLVKDDTLSSVLIEEHEVMARNTKLGDEEITRDIPNLPIEALKDIDENGIVKVGAEVKSGDILIGKITPRAEPDVTSEEKILNAIFGDKSKEVRDTSLRMPNGESGTVVGVHVINADEAFDLPDKVLMAVKVYVAQKRKIAPGDKLSGRHGNKGVISKILPVEDMPYMEDGTPVDIVLNPLGVPSRMNLGQVLEVHLGWAAKHGWDLTKAKDKKILDLVPPAAHIVPPNSLVSTPIFDGMDGEAMQGILENTLPNESGWKLVGGDGKATLFDGRTGEKFPDKITVGYMYVIKLHHLVEDKMHARSTGPYSIITAQPLGGKAQFGGQRFGEMEVWALEAYGAANSLREMMTVKSDDITGREKVYRAIVKGDNIPQSGIPESFRVLYKELQSVAVNIKTFDAQGKEIKIDEDTNPRDKKQFSELGIDLSAKPLSVKTFTEQDSKGK